MEYCHDTQNRGRKSLDIYTQFVITAKIIAPIFLSTILIYALNLTSDVAFEVKNY